MNPMMLLSALKGTASKVPTWLYIVALVGLAYFFNILGLKDFVQSFKAKQSTKAYQDQKVTVDNPDNPNPIEINLSQIAADIYQCFHGGFWKWTENEKRAISLIKSVPAPMRSDVAILYAQKGSDMYEDFRKYLRDDQYNEVEAFLR